MEFNTTTYWRYQKTQAQFTLCFGRLVLFAKKWLPMANASKRVSLLESDLLLFHQVENIGLIEYIHDCLRDELRKKAGKETSPSMGIIDSQSVKTTRSGAEFRGYDGGKKVKGRKRHIMVDSMGLIMGVVVHCATDHDSKMAPLVFKEIKGKYSRLKKVVADGGYRGDLIKNVKKQYKIELDSVLRKQESKFEILPKRWIVERTFAWFESYRRLSKDYEFDSINSKAMIQLAMIRLMLNRAS